MSGFDGAPEKKWLLFQCLHGMGHGLDMTLDHDLPRALRACDLLDERWHRESCYGGAFMENIAQVSMPDHPANMLAAERSSGKRMDAMMDMSTGHAVHSTTPPSHFLTYDRNDLQYPCSIVDSRYGFECYRIQTALILYLNHGDLPATAKACDQAPKEFRAACYQSLVATSLCMPITYASERCSTATSATRTCAPTATSASPTRSWTKELSPRRGLQSAAP